MNVALTENFLLVLVLTFCSSVVAKSQQSHETEHKPTQEFVEPYYKGIESFEANGKYELILKNSEKKVEEAKEKLRKLKEQHGADTTQDKSESEKNNIYFKLAKMLPAGTVFRIFRAHDNFDGNVTVIVETKYELSKDSVLPNPEIISFGNVPAALRANPVYVKPDISTFDLPGGWDKEKGYQEIIQLLTPGVETAKVSVVFNNPGNSKKYWERKPYGSTIRKLFENKKGKAYGFGYSEDELIWWTQGIDLEQAIELYENELVINLIPRQ